MSEPTQTAASVTVTLQGFKYRRITSGTGATLALDANGNTVVTVSTAGLMGPQWKSGCTAKPQTIMRRTHHESCA